MKDSKALKILKDIEDKALAAEDRETKLVSILPYMT